MFHSGCLEMCLWDSRGKPAPKFRVWLNLICSSHCKEHAAYGNIVVMGVMALIICSLCLHGFRDFHIAGQKVALSNGTYSWSRRDWTLLIMKYEHSGSSSQVLCSIRKVCLNGSGLVSVQFRSYVTEPGPTCRKKPWCEGVAPSFATRMALIFFVYCIHKFGIKLGLSKNAWLQCIWRRWKLYINYEGCWQVLSPTTKETSYSDQTRDLFNVLPTKLNTLLNPFHKVCKSLKKIRSFSVQPGLRGSNDLRVGRKMATFQLFSVQGTGGSPTGPDPESRVRDQENESTGRPISSGMQVPGEAGIIVKEQHPVFPLKCPSIAPAEMSNTPRW
jgi:hypothetical protein